LIRHLGRYCSVVLDLTVEFNTLIAHCSYPHSRVGLKVAAPRRQPASGFVRFYWMEISKILGPRDTKLLYR
jgi:hypothetical protein